MHGPPSYYGDHPLAVAPPLLRRSVVLSGAPGVPTGLVGATLCSLGGWPFVEIERAVEHDARHTIARLIQREGVAMVSARCWSHLARTLARSRPAIIAVPALALAAPQRLAHIRAHADHHHLAASVDDQLAWLASRPVADTTPPGWFADQELTRATVDDRHQQCAAVAGAADMRHHMVPRSHLRTARHLQALLSGSPDDAPHQRV